MSRRGAGLAATSALVALVALCARGQEPQGPPVAPPPADADAAPVGSPGVTTAGSGAPAAVSTASPGRRARRGLSMRGMALPLHSLDPGYDYGPALAELPGLGATHVAIFVNLWQPEATSPTPARHPLRTPADRVLRRVISDARARGLEVAFIPSLQLERAGPRDWRGSLRPPSWERWFQGYGRELLHWARLAEDEGVSLLAVGSELSTADGEEARWRELIRDVRAEFSGELTYSANWDHFDQVRFWDALDYVGLSAYFELTTSSDPTPEELQGAWRRQRGALATWRHQRGLRQPFVLLEVGYASLDGAAAQPWNYTLDTRVDLDEQRLCYEAFAEAWKDAPELLAGAFFYEWWGEGGRRDRTYTPRGKPALEVVKALFGAPPPAKDPAKER